VSETNETSGKPRLKGQPVWLGMDLYGRLGAVRDRLGGSLASHARRAIEAYVLRHERKAEKETRGAE
jgi:hypothetical protein